MIKVNIDNCIVLLAMAEKTMDALTLKVNEFHKDGDTKKPKVWTVTGSTLHGRAQKSFDTREEAEAYARHFSRMAVPVEAAVQSALKLALLEEINGGGND